MKNLTCLFVLSLMLFLQSGCKDTHALSCSDVEKRDGYTLTTYYNAEGKIAASVITDDAGSLVVMPSTPEAMGRKIGDEEAKCLQKCKKADGSYDTNCILLCPLTKHSQVFGRFVAATNVIN